MEITVDPGKYGAADFPRTLLGDLPGLIGTLADSDIAIASSLVDKGLRPHNLKARLKNVNFVNAYDEAKAHSPFPPDYVPTNGDVITVQSLADVRLQSKTSSSTEVVVVSVVVMLRTDASS